MTNNTRLQYLFNRWLAREATAEEKQELAEIISNGSDDAVLTNLLGEAWDQHQPADTVITPQAAGLILKNILGEEKAVTADMYAGRKKTWWKYAAAAAILLMVAAGAWWMLNHAHNKEQNIAGQLPSVQKDILPGKNGAILTLANGQQLVLDSSRNGLLTQQGNVNITRQNDQLVYSQSAKADGEVLFNTLSTPRGRKYRLVLPDGSNVWLNASSSIRYPTVFTGNERKVEITGEAYFEVVHNAAKPFMVHFSSPLTGGGGREGTVQVLGTHFNINSYTDEESTKITLLEGSVKVTNTLSGKILKPGQQASLLQGAGMKITEADTEEATAWKNGLFQFEGTNIQSVMRQLVRWYDIDVQYQGTVAQQFYGNISRDVTISNVLKMLETTKGVKFTIEGNKVIVSP